MTAWAAGLPIAIVSEFLDALRLVVEPREAQTGAVQVGGAGEFASLAAQHVLVSLVALAVAAAVALPAGLYLGHRGRGEFVAVAMSNAGRSVPALGLLGMFIAFVGIGFTNVALVLALIAIPPILTNAYVGVRQVDRDAVDAARGMGMTDAEIVARVELPLAAPLIVSGLRLATVAVVATATIGPLADTDTLGRPIINNNVYGDAGPLAGAIAVAVLTLLADQAVRIGGRLLTPRGLRLRAGDGDGDGGRLARLDVPSLKTGAQTV